MKCLILAAGYAALSADGEFSEAAPESGRKVHPRLAGG